MARPPQPLLAAAAAIRRSLLTLALCASPCLTACNDRLDPLREREIADGGLLDSAPTLLSVTALYPIHGADLLRYVARDMTKSATEQSDTPCDPSGWTYYHQCLHGGELRKVVIPGQIRCDGLTLRDQLDALRWVCDDSSAKVFFYSTGFKPGKGLKDILEPDAFAANKVLLQKEGRLLAESPSSTSWWNNPVAELVLNSGVADAALELDGEGTIYTVAQSGSSRGIVIKAHRVALVVLDGATLSDADPVALDCSPSSVGADTCLVYGETGDYAWIEGKISTASSERAIVQGTFGGQGVRRWRYHGLTLSAAGANSTGLYIESGDGAMLSRAEVWGQYRAIYVGAAKNVALHHVRMNSAGPSTASIGVNAWHAVLNDCQITKGMDQALDVAAWYVTIANCRIYNSAGKGIRATFARSPYLINTLIANNGEEGAVFDSLRTHILAATSANNGGPGVLVEDNGTSPAFTIEGLVSVNNAKGLEVQMGGGRLGNLYLGHNDTGVEVNNAATGLVFSDDLVLGANAADCLVTSTGLDPGLESIGGACALQGASDATITAGVSSAGFFSGPATSDSTNAHASASELSTNISDWFGFEKAHRVWGRDGGYGAAAVRGSCEASESCRIWDWTLLPGATALYRAHGAFTPGAPCPPAVHGDQTFKYSDHAGQDAYALRHAVEIFGDLRGNENGFCDSGEACLFMPHIGAYQGSGPLSLPCIFDDGVGANAVEGVTLLSH